MLARTPLRYQAIAWLEQQDPDQRYGWGDYRTCACAQFAKSIGRYDEWESEIKKHHLKEGPWQKLNRYAAGLRDVR